MSFCRWCWTCAAASDLACRPYASLRSGDSAWGCWEGERRRRRGSTGTASTGADGGNYKKQKKKTRKQERAEFIAKLDALEQQLAAAQQRIEELEGDNRKLRTGQKSLQKRCEKAERKVEGLSQALDHAKKVAMKGRASEVPHIPIDTFLAEAGLGFYVRLFLMHGVTSTRELVVMKEAKLESIGVKVGHRRRLKVAVERLVEDDD